jgi:hypothetical protein
MFQSPKTAKMKTMLNRMKLPQKVGESIEIPVCSPATRRELERRGYFITKVTPQHYTIRLDYPNGLREMY